MIKIRMIDITIEENPSIKGLSKTKTTMTGMQSTVSTYKSKISVLPLMNLMHRVWIILKSPGNQITNTFI